MKYFVLIGDIVESREIPQRSIFKESFKAAIDDLNTQFSRDLISPFTVTLGDEFQAVLHDTSQLFIMIHQLQLRFGQKLIRFALGCGGIETEINRENAIGMDGPAFHHARRAMEQAKANNRHLFYSGDDLHAALANQLLGWIDLTCDRWKKERLNILYLYRKGANQRQIAQKLKMTQPAVSQNLNSPGVRAVIESERLLEETFNKEIEV